MSKYATIMKIKVRISYFCIFCMFFDKRVTEMMSLIHNSEMLYTIWELWEC